MRGAAPRDAWDSRARRWLALVAVLAAPALASPLALLRLPEAFPTSLVRALTLFVDVSGYAIGFAALASLAAGVATYRGGLATRVVVALWTLVGVAASVAFTTAGRLAAYGI